MKTEIISVDKLTTFVLVFSPKTYSTIKNAQKFGNCLDAAPIKMLNGQTKWIALPFFKFSGGIYSYSEGTQK